MTVRIEARDYAGQEDYVSAIEVPEEDADTVAREWSRVYGSVSVVEDASDDSEFKRPEDGSDATPETDPSFVKNG